MPGEEYRYTSDGYVRTASGSLERPFIPRSVSCFAVDLATLKDDLPPMSSPMRRDSILSRS